MEPPPPDPSHVLDPLGLVAGMFEALGIGESIDQATQQNPEMRRVTAGHAVKALVLHGLGCVNPQLYLVPRFFQTKPTSRLITPGITAEHLNDEAWGRALETLYASGVTELDSLIAATAAKRWGLVPTCAHLDRTSFHVAGRDHSDEAPEAHVVHITRGYSRDHRPDRNQVMLELSVEHQAGLPLLMKPLSGHSRDAHECGEVIRQPIQPWHLTYGTTDLVAASALDSADHLQKLAHTQLKWITRVPAPLRAAQEALRQAEPPSMTPLMAGDCYHELASAYGDVAQRWLLIHSTARQPQVQRPVNPQLLQPSDREVNAFKNLCGTTFACEAEAQQALSTFEQGWQATVLEQRTVRPTPRDGQRGRPGQGALPAHLVYSIAGALASRLAARQALIAQQRGFILATTALDDSRLPPQALLEGYTGQGHVERGVRFLKDPCFLASARSRNKPERIMAWLMVMTVCLLVYAALEDRIRHALQEQGAPFPDQHGQRTQPPTARWVFHDFVGIHVLCRPQPWPIVINLTAAHQPLLQLLGKRYVWFYRCIVTQIKASVQHVCFMTSNIRKNHEAGAECRLQW